MSTADETIRSAWEQARETIRHRFLNEGLISVDLETVREQMRLMEDHYSVGDPIGHMGKLLTAAEIAMALPELGEREILAFVRMLGVEKFFPRGNAMALLVGVVEGITGIQKPVTMEVLDRFNREMAMTVTEYEERLSQSVRMTIAGLYERLAQVRGQRDERTNVVLMLKATEKEIMRLIRRHVNPEGVESLTRYMDEAGTKVPEYDGTVGRFSLTLAMLHMVFALGYVNLEEMRSFSAKFDKIIAMEIETEWSRLDPTKWSPDSDSQNGQDGPKRARGTGSRN